MREPGEDGKARSPRSRGAGGGAIRNGIVNKGSAVRSDRRIDFREQSLLHYISLSFRAQIASLCSRREHLRVRERGGFRVYGFLKFERVIVVKKRSHFSEKRPENVVWCGVVWIMSVLKLLLKINYVEWNCVPFI